MHSVTRRPRRVEIQCAATLENENCALFSSHHNNLITDAVIRIQVQSRWGNPRSATLVCPDLIRPRARLLGSRHVCTGHE